MITWPSNVPECPLLEDYKRDEVDSRLISKVDAGLNKIRRRYSAVPINVTESFIMNKTQYSVFRDWYDNVVKGGSLVFSKHDPLSDTDREYRFVGVPSYAPVGGRYIKVTLQLEVMP